MNSRFAIVDACHKRWADLAAASADGRQRFCGDCQRYVHAIDQYSPEQWDQIWHESKGRVCGLLCGVSPAEPRTRRAVLVGALLTAISPLRAQTGRLRIRVVDVNGAMITTAEVSLLGTDDKPRRTGKTNAVGEVVWTDLPLGDSSLAIWAPGFKKRLLTTTLRNSEEMKIEVTLEVGSVGGVAIVDPRLERENTSTLPARA